MSEITAERVGHPLGNFHMRIGLDIDGVMYQWEKTVRYIFREVYPNPLPHGAKEALKTEATSWFSIRDIVGKTAWNWLWNEGVKLGLFRYGHLYPGTIQAVRTLAKMGEVVLITHRPKQAVNDTLAWLGFLDLPLSGIHILVNQENKGLVRPACDVYLDDKPENVRDFLDETNAMVYLMRRPWNMDHQGFNNHPRYREVCGWTDFVRNLKAGSAPIASVGSTKV